jgi:hypothetical protein
MVKALMLDLVEWLNATELGRGHRCLAPIIPQTPGLEDANDRGLVTTESVKERCVVRITSSGSALLEQRETMPFDGNNLHV